MQRVDVEEILDSDSCPAPEAKSSLQDMGRINRWFGGVATTRQMIERIAAETGRKHFSMLEVASGLGEVPGIASRQLARRGITLDVIFLDRLRSHLPIGNHTVVADALALPFADGAFDLVSSSLFAHHLAPGELAQFVHEGLRVSRVAVLINDLIRHPIHLLLAYAGWPLMRSHISRLDGVASVKRAYEPEELRKILAANVLGAEIEISRHYLFRMGAIVWKNETLAQSTWIAA